MPLLSRKVAVISGASSGVGRAAARLFVNEGACVVLTSRRTDMLQTLADEIADIGGQARFVAGDVSDEHVHSELVNVAEREFGGLDIAFNNAGDLGEMGPCENINPEGWRRTLDVNLTASFLAARMQIPALRARGGGSIVFTSTFVGHTLGFPGMAAYGAAKAGVIGLMRVIATENAAHGIRANALLPGGIDTPMGNRGAGSPEGLEFVKSIHALKRIAQPEEIAGAALYLASELSSFVTGSAHYVDGGVTVSRS